MLLLLVEFRYSAVVCHDSKVNGDKINLSSMFV